MKTTIYFDMDGTIADLYGVTDWLGYLLTSDVFPYVTAEPMVRMCTLARLLNRLQRDGYNIGVISWLSKGGNNFYNKAVTEAKLKWLHDHLPSVNWDEIHIVPYGTPKQNFCHTPYDILFDDEINNRANWTGFAYPAEIIISVLKTL